MAKTKTFSVEVEITQRVRLLVVARRPNGAVERLQTDEGWREAAAYQDDIEFPFRFDPTTMKIVEIRAI